MQQLGLWITLTLAWAAFAPAHAQDVDEQTKAKALKCAYRLNDNSMARWGSIDVSQMDLDQCVPKSVRVIPIVPQPKGKH